MALKHRVKTSGVKTGRDQEHVRSTFWKKSRHAPRGTRAFLAFSASTENNPLEQEYSFGSKNNPPIEAK
jgi:hypothetical protein